MTAHANPRLYVGPKTNEIIIGLGRSYETTMACDLPNIVLKVKRRSCKKQCYYELISFVVDKDGCAHFELSDEFLAEADKGFYDATLHTISTDPCIPDCKIGQIEIIKAPGVYIKGSAAIDTCNETKWVEPSCEVEKKPSCGCGRAESTEGCYFCNKKFISAKINSVDGYGMTRLDEVAECEDETPEVQP